MGIIRAFFDAGGGTFADQWKDIITVDAFGERDLLKPGYLKAQNRGRGSNLYGSEDIISNGSLFFVPENTAAIIYSQAGIEDFITEPGGFEYQNGQKSVFNRDGLFESLFTEWGHRIDFGGVPSDEKHIGFLNLRELRDIKFGTKGPLVYHDKFYEADMEVTSFGRFAVRVVNPLTVVRKFIPPNVRYYTLDDRKSREHLVAEFLQELITQVGGLSVEHRISELPSHMDLISKALLSDDQLMETWEERFGLRITQVAIESIQMSEESKELVRQYNEKRMDVSAYSGISPEDSDQAAKQKIADGIRENGFGDGGGMIFGMDMAREASAGFRGGGMAAITDPIDSQIEGLRKLKKLVDEGILTQEEFDAKKRKILEL